jgi:hypothetical protein
MPFTFILMSLFVQRHLYLQLYEKLFPNLLGRTMSSGTLNAPSAGNAPAYAELTARCLTCRPGWNWNHLNWALPFGSRINKLNSQWDSNPHAKYPQVHHFMGGIEPPEVYATWHSPMGARLSVSPWEKVVLKGNLSRSGQHGSITP